jgi:hypothetical protein
VIPSPRPFYTGLSLELNGASRRRVMAAGAAGLVGSLLQGCGGASAQTVPAPLPYPDIADTSGASPELADFMKAFFAAKTRHNVDETMSFFAPDMVAYIDAGIGWDFAGFAAVKATYQEFMPKWPASAKSYPTRILGDMSGGAVVAFTDTPELFGGELRVIGSIDFKNGKITRWVDHWDFNAYDNLFGLARTPLSDYRQAAVGESAAAAMRTAAASLCTSLSTGKHAAAAALFSSDAVYEDMALRVQLQGRQAIQRYLSRTVMLLPFGAGMTLRHTLGSARGGGFEWNGGTASQVRTGVAALTLDADGQITRMTTVYDAALLSAPQRALLLSLSVDA